MKKLSGLFLIFLLFGILFYFQIISADLGSSLDEKVAGIEEGIEKIEDIAKDDSGEYLKQEWTKILQNTEGGRRVLVVNNFIATYFNWFFKLVLGVEYSLSWAFVFSILVWVGLFLFLINPISSFSQNKLVGGVSAFLVSSLIGLAGGIKVFVNIVSSFVDNRFLFWISLIVLIILVLVMNILGRYVSKYITQSKERFEKEHEELDRASLKVFAKQFKKIGKS